MSWGTSFGLSLKNLFTKKGRTILTSFAGSIGIIGIALIFAVSNGMTTYINAVQEDTLSSYPLTLEATTVDISTLMRTFMGIDSEDSDAHELDAIYSQSVMADMINALNNLDSTENDLAAFKKYLMQEMAKPESSLPDALTGIQYTYNMDLLVYTKDTDGNIIYSDTEEMLTEALRENMGMDMTSMMNMQQSMTGMSSTMMMPGMQTNLWCEILAGKDGRPVNPVLEDQYDVIYGSWPNSYDEIVLVVDENNELQDMTLYALGLKPAEEIEKVNALVQEAVLEGYGVDIREMSINEAKEMGATALFSEKYGDTVRVVNMGGYSIELCGGTHLDNTAKVGSFRITSEASVASGVRRIEAITGKAFVADAAKTRETLGNVCAAVKVKKADELEAKLNAQLEEIKALKKEIEQFKAKEASGGADDIIKNAKTVKGLKVVALSRSGISADDLRKLGDFLRDKASNIVALIASVNEGKITFLATGGKDAVAKGVKAGDIIKTIAPIVGGKGGGKADMARGSGKERSAKDALLAKAAETLG